MMDVKERRVLVIGGGKVALRKCRLFLDFGARVTVVAPEFCPELFQMAGRVELVRDVYREKYLDGAFVLVAASDDSEVNRAAACAAKETGTLVNAVDDPPNCSFFIPAVIRRGDLTLCISTGGKSPSLAAGLRRELEETLDDDIELRLEVLGDLRGQLMELENDPAVRRKILIRAAGLKAAELDEYIKEVLSKY